jgi:hypothetical protein
MVEYLPWRAMKTRGVDASRSAIFLRKGLDWGRLCYEVCAVRRG